MVTFCHVTCILLFSSSAEKIFFDNDYYDYLLQQYDWNIAAEYIFLSSLKSKHNNNSLMM